MSALIAAGMIGLSACSTSPGEKLCQDAAGQADLRELASAAQLYVQAQQQDAGGCADDGLAAVNEHRTEAITAVEQGAAAEQLDDLDRARHHYREALDLDVGNAEAVAGLLRVQQRPTEIVSTWLRAQRLHDEGYDDAAEAEIVRVLREHPETVVPESLVSLAPDGATSRTGSTPANTVPRASEPIQDETDATGLPLVLWILLAIVVLLVAGIAVLRAVRLMRSQLGDLATAQQQLISELKNQDRTGKEISSAVKELTSELRAATAEISRLEGRLTDERERTDRLVAAVAAGRPPVLEVEYFGATGAVAATAHRALRDAAEEEGGGAEVFGVDIMLVSVPAPGTTDLGRLVLLRQKVDLDGVRELSGLTQEPHGTGIDLQGAFYDAMGKRLVDATRPTVTEYWITPDLMTPAAAGDLIEDSRESYHDLVLGQPIVDAGGLLGVPAPPLALLKDVVREVKLPGDDFLAGARCLIHVTGVVVGTAAGVPLLVNACLKSLAYETLSYVAGQVIREVVSELLQPSDRETAELTTADGTATAERSALTTPVADLERRLRAELATRELDESLTAERRATALRAGSRPSR